MDTCVATPQHSIGLPSVGFFETNKFKRDEMDQSRRSSSNATSPTSFRFPTSTYSNPSQGSTSGIISPPTSRRTSSEERMPSQSARQSLPSIHEALGRDSSLGYSGLPPPPPPPLSTSLNTSTAPYLHPPTSTAAPEPPRRPFTQEPSPIQPQSNHAVHNSQPKNPVSTHQHSPPRPSPLQGPSIFASQTKVPPVPPIRTGASPPTPGARSAHAYPPSQQATSPYESGPQSAPPNPPYGYSGYPSQYPYPPSSSSGHGYPAPAVLSAPPQYASSNTWKNERDYQSLGSKSQVNHKENVKRKLDQFQFEATIHDIRSFGHELSSFAEQCMNRAYDSQTGAYQAITNVHEVDKFASKLKSMQETFHLLREVIVQPNTLMKGEDKYPTPITNGYMHHESNGYSEEPKASNMFPQTDTKKRRGRAAPPGRCHSCNRAETPEWRRGPDGARTLCNACGLHYAKLARKLGNNNKTTISSSNLRPKSLGPGGPPPGPTTGPSLQP